MMNRIINQMLIPPQRGWLLLPRPWLSSDVLGRARDGRYVSGAVRVDGRRVELAYWHRVIDIKRRAASHRFSV
jgi:hypothetical protein